VDGSDLFYTCACWKIDRIPPTAVGGLFRSLLLTHEERAIVVELSAILLIRLDRKDLNKSIAVGGIYNTLKMAFFVERI
jgi:hypothetical protein